MVNSMGHEFSDVGGNNIQTIPGGGDVTIDKEGLIFQNGQNIGKPSIYGSASQEHVRLLWSMLPRSALLLEADAVEMAENPMKLHTNTYYSR